MNQKQQYIPQEYWQKRLSKDFSLTGVGYLRFKIEYNIWLYKARLYVLQKLLKKADVNCNGKNLLDIGIGTGFYIDFWEKQGVKNITGIDITSKSIEELKRKYPNYNFIKADIGDEMESFNERFDIITAFDVLFHIVREDKFKQAIKNIKKFSHSNTIILIMDNFLKEYKQTRGHENDRTLEYYKKILDSHSIDIKIIEPIFFFMNAPIDIERINNRLTRFTINSMWRINKEVNWYFKKLGTFGRGLTYSWALILYILDRLILKWVSVGPSTKLILAKPRQQTQLQ
ncbi:MAG TPA: class I SAM-dependent methyltransferase [bacterium]|nr:class I SAM-dependent methyltransferase [bacterium]